MLDHPLSEVDAAITSKLEELASFLRKQDARVDMTARTDYDLTKAHRLYIILLRATTSPRTEEAAVTRWKQEADSLPAEDFSHYAMMARGITLSHRDFLISNEQR